MSRLLQRLQAGKLLVMDGAMGTELARRGARLGAECLELWNLTRPEEVSAIHRAYLDAGAGCLLTNTFQANAQALRPHRLEGCLAEIWHAGVRLARDHPGRDPLVLADIGPLATMSLADAWPILNACRGVDGLLLETFCHVGHLYVFARLNRARLGPHLPLLVSFAFERSPEGRLRTHQKYEPDGCAQAAVACGAVALGVNCGKDMDMQDLLEVVRAYRRVTDLPLFVRPNAGTPDAQGCHPHSPAALAARLPALLEAGVTMIGGCCGTTPAHIAAFHKVCTVEAPSGCPNLPA